MEPITTSQVDIQESSTPEEKLNAAQHHLCDTIFVKPVSLEMLPPHNTLGAIVITYDTKAEAEHALAVLKKGREEYPLLRQMIMTTEGLSVTDTEGACLLRPRPPEADPETDTETPSPEVSGIMVSPKVGVLDLSKGVYNLRLTLPPDHQASPETTEEAMAQATKTLTTLASILDNDAIKAALQPPTENVRGGRSR